MGFKKIQTDNQDLSLVQDQVAASLNEIDRKPFVGGLLLSGIELITGQDNLVPHLLDRIPQIWVVAGIDSNSTIWSPEASELGNLSSDPRFINLRCSANCVVSLWVA